jgi:hypothetical protein
MLHATVTESCAASDVLLRRTRHLGRFTGTALPFRITVAPGALPDVLLTSGAMTNVLVPSQLSIFAQASVAVCPGMKMGSAALTYIWSCSRDDAVSTSVDPRFFKLDPFTFNATQIYSLQVVVIDDLGLNNSAATKIVVGQSELVAAIEGGDRIVGVSEPLVLDATPSADPDYRGGSAGLLFDWSCEVADAETEALGSVCVSTMTGDAVQSLNVGAENLGLFHFRRARLSFFLSPTVEEASRDRGGQQPV